MKCFHGCLKKKKKVFTARAAALTRRDGQPRACRWFEVVRRTRTLVRPYGLTWLHRTSIKQQHRQRTSAITRTTKSAPYSSHRLTCGPSPHVEPAGADPTTHTQCDASTQVSFPHAPRQLEPPPPTTKSRQATQSSPWLALWRSGCGGGAGTDSRRLLVLRGAGLEGLPAVLLLLGGGRPLLHQHTTHGHCPAATGEDKTEDEQLG